MNRKAILAILAILALIAGAWWAWRSHTKPPVTPAVTQAQEAITTATEAIAEAETAIKKGKAILKRIPGEVKAIEENAVSAADRATLDELADRANGRIREWVRQHPAGDAVRSSDAGAGAVLSGGGGTGE